MIKGQIVRLFERRPSSPSSVRRHAIDGTFVLSALMLEGRRMPETSAY